MEKRKYVRVKQKSFIVSSEKYFTWILKPEKDSDAYLAHRFFFPDIFKQIRIIVYVRHPLAYFIKYYSADIEKINIKPLEEITKKNC